VAESRRVVAEQLSEVAGIMDRAACDLYSLNSLPDELSEKICRQMKKNGAFVQKIWLQERPKEHLQIYMTVKAGRHCRITLRQTAELIGSLCGIPMVAVRDGAQVLSGEYQTVLFQEDVKFQVLYGVGRITKEQESISGDNYSVLCENGQFVLCLSDGMGSGIEANRESETVVELFEQFLRAGFPRIMAARMINSMLLLQPKEGMFSTFDVASINLYTGVCSFLKGGASPTFLRRDTWVEVVESTSLAAGLVSQTDFDTTTKKLYDGDYLVMMTDGVLDALPGDRTEQMKQLLLEVKNSEPREFARELLERVLRLGGCRARDDMTVLVARIWKK
jgi:stage II sporulation protein E